MGWAKGGGVENVNMGEGTAGVGSGRESLSRVDAGAQWVRSGDKGVGPGEGGWGAEEECQVRR